MSVPKNINAWLAVNTNPQTVKTLQTQIWKVCARHSEQCELPPTDNVQKYSLFLQSLVRWKHCISVHFSESKKQPSYEILLYVIIAKVTAVPSPPLWLWI